MAASAGTKKKEAPSEPFKRALGLAVRAIAGDELVQVSYAPGKPELDGSGNCSFLPSSSGLPGALDT